MVDSILSSKAVNCEYWYEKTITFTPFDKIGNDNKTYNLVYFLIINVSSIMNNSREDEDSIENMLPAMNCWNASI